MPNLSNVLVYVSGSLAYAFLIYCTIPMFDEYLSTSPILYLPVPLSRYISSVIFCLPKKCTFEGYALTESLAVTLPSVSIAVTATVLNIEPGSIMRQSAWLGVGLLGMLSAVSRYTTLPLWSTLLVRLTIAFMSPVLVSIRTAQPAGRWFSTSTFLSAVSQMSSISVLMVVCMSIPATGAFFIFVMAFPFLLVSLRPSPGMPSRYWLYFFSRPLSSIVSVSLLVVSRTIPKVLSPMSPKMFLRSVLLRLSRLFLSLLKSLSFSMKSPLYL